MMKRVLVTNDDGIHAEGIKTLASLAERYFEEVWVFAPKSEASQIGHKVTTYEPIRFEEIKDRWFSIDGAPADCTRVGLHLLGEDRKPDWVWSGINHGGNLGKHDYFISGTMAAAREAAFFGIRALGVSHYLKRGLEHAWDLAGNRAGEAFDQIQSELKSGEGFSSEIWSVNLPHTAVGEPEPEVIFCEPESQPLDVLFSSGDKPNELYYRGEYHGRPRFDGSDVDVCFNGNIAVSRIPV